MSHPSTEEALATCREALAGTAEALLDHWVHAKAGFTCSEAEMLYEAYRAVGLDALAEEFMCWHAESDDDDTDLHVVTSTHENGCPASWGYAEGSEIQ